MSQGQSVSNAVVFGSENLVKNAQSYKANKRMVDAASAYETLDDAMAALSDTWAALEAQVENGGGYTPDASLGFGSDNAAVIASKLLGRGQTVGATRKAFSAVGKV